MIRPVVLCLFTYFTMITTTLAFDLQGHRGARGLMPENTLPAFATALTLGVTTLELDTGISRDGVVVVSHNPYVDGNIARGGGGGGGDGDNWINDKPQLNQLTFAQLQKFDVGRARPGSRVARQFADQQAVDGTTMPSLADVFELVKKSGNSQVRFNIETKINPLEPDLTADVETFTKNLLDVVAEYGLQDRVSIQSFDWRTLQAVQKADASIKTVYLTAQQNWLNNVAAQTGNASRWTAGFNLSDYNGNVADLIKAAGGDVWSPFYRDINADSVKAAHQAGLQIIPWTINDEATMDAFIKMGVDGIITDYPDRLRQAMTANGLELPKATPVDY